MYKNKKDNIMINNNPKIHAYFVKKTSLVEDLMSKDNEKVLLLTNDDRTRYLRISANGNLVGDNIWNGEDVERYSLQISDKFIKIYQMAKSFYKEFSKERAEVFEFSYIISDVLFQEISNKLKELGYINAK